MMSFRRDVLYNQLPEAGCGSSVDSDAAWYASGTETDPRVRHIIS